MPEMTVGHMIEDIMDAEVIVHAMQADAYVDDHQVPVDDAGMGEPLFEAGPVFSEDPIPVVPVQEIPVPEAEVEVEVEADDQDAADDIVALEDQPEDPPVIDISSDDKDDGEEHEPGYGGWLDEIDEFEDDPEEILFDDRDWDVDSDTSSVVTIELVQMYAGKAVDTSILILIIYVKYDATDMILEDGTPAQNNAHRLREQLARINQRPQVNEVPPPVHQAPPVVPPVPEVQPEISRNAEALEFEGPTDPIAAYNWLIDIQVILDFMRLTEQKKMFRTDISKQVSAGSSPPTLVSDCVSRAIRVEYWINQDKEARAQIFKARKEEKVVVSQMQPRQNTESSPKGHNINPAQSSKQFGRNKRKGNFTGQGQQRNYPQKRNNRGNEVNCMQSKQGLKDPQFRKAD
ncbi:hypothetical protein TIFTF001_046184 [Ficus carica]|uniref:Uncharacterized protein n=1 Tax=Ficus carica TaxID=3494 RepID=A0AA87ZJY0_FICCA|nr:hypothetical protein TIFTF001_046184 [Ficus carica]